MNRDFSNLDGEVIDYDIIQASDKMTKSHYDDTFNPDGHIDGVNSFNGDGDDFYDSFDDYYGCDGDDTSDFDGVMSDDDLMYSEARGRRRKRTRRPRKGQAKRQARRSERQNRRRSRKDQRLKRRGGREDRRNQRQERRDRRERSRSMSREQRAQAKMTKEQGKAQAGEDQSRTMQQLAQSGGGDDELTRAMLATAPPTTTPASTGMSKGMKIGLIVGGVLVVAAIGFAIYKASAGKKSTKGK
jgi:hypothetical protein